MALDKGPMKTD